MQTSTPTPTISPGPPADVPANAPQRRGVSLPGWLAVLILIGVASGFGYLGWRLLRTDPGVDLSQYESNDQRRSRAFANNAGQPIQIFRPAAPPVPPPEGVTLEASGSGNARTNGMSASFLVNGAKTNVVIASPQRQGIDPNDTLAARVRALAMNDAARRAAANVTPEQVAKLGNLKFAQMPPVDAASRAKLVDLWTKLRAADAAARPPIEQEIMTALRDIAAARTAADTAAYHATAEQIRGVLSADQIAKLRAPVPAK